MGTSQIQLRGVSTKCLVSPLINNEIFFGWKDLMKLGVITENFPNPTKTSTARICNISKHGSELLKQVDSLLEK